MDMLVSQAQADMRDAYCSGAAGMLASAVAWGAAAVTAVMLSPAKAIVVLLATGMLIHPAAILLCRMMGARGVHRDGNPLGQLAGASTFWLVFSLFLAWGISLQRPDWFFPAMLLIIGGRYLVLSTVFGLRLYWALGLALAVAGFGLGWLGMSPLAGATAGAAIEAVFAVACLAAHRRTQAARELPAAALKR